VRLVTAKWQFTSYERDSESSNDYVMFRSYVNRLGRFSSPDPIAGSLADPQSLNRYAYVRDDPNNLADPLGLFIVVTDIPEDIWSLFFLMFGGGGGGGQGSIIEAEFPIRSGGGGAGGGRSPHVNLEVLDQCIRQLFGVSLKEFNQSSPNNNGSFAGYGPDSISNGGNDADIYVINDTSRSSTQLGRMAAREGGRVPPGSILVGLTLPSNPYRNYTSSMFRGAVTMAKAQVHELGNSLQLITGAAFNPATVPGSDKDPGQLLENCVNGKKGFKP
jgi:RHS repeat-associated protein